MARLLRAPSPAMVVALLALVVSLSGVGYAVSQIGTSDIANGAVTSPKLHEQAVKPRKLAPKVYADLVRGGGDLISRAYDAQEVGFLPAPQPVLAEIPGFGQVQFIYCNDMQMRVRLLSSDDSTPFHFAAEVRDGGIPVGTGQDHKVDSDAGTLSQGGGTPLITPAITPNGFTLGLGAKWDFQVWRGTDTNTTGAHVTVSGVDQGTSCHVGAQTIIDN